MKQETKRWLEFVSMILVGFVAATILSLLWVASR